MTPETTIAADGTVHGTLKYVTKYTQFSDAPAEQQGNYFPFELQGDPGDTMTIKKNGAVTKDSVEYDSSLVFRVDNNDTTFEVDVDGQKKIGLNFKKAVLNKA